LANSPGSQSVGLAAKADAVVELPEKVPVIVPAEKFPEASLLTIVLAVFAFVAAEVSEKADWKSANLVAGRYPLTREVAAGIEIVFTVLTRGELKVSGTSNVPEASTSKAPPTVVGTEDQFPGVVGV
jgi:hypothetical protein